MILRFFCWWVSWYWYSRLSSDSEISIFSFGSWIFSSSWVIKSKISSRASICFASALILESVSSYSCVFLEISINVEIVISGVFSSWEAFFTKSLSPWACFLIFRSARLNFWLTLLISSCGLPDISIVLSKWSKSKFPRKALSLFSFFNAFFTKRREIR